MLNQYTQYHIIPLCHNPNPKSDFYYANIEQTEASDCAINLQLHQTDITIHHFMYS